MRESWGYEHFDTLSINSAIWQKACGEVLEELWSLRGSIVGWSVKQPTKSLSEVGKERMQLQPN